MTRARRTQIDLESTPYYHCMSRCVRRAFLCGTDKHTGVSYDHRKQWIVDCIAHLADAFAIELAAYAVMSNHFHVVLYVNEAKAESWSVREVITQWLKLCKGSKLVNRFHRHEELSPAELKVIDNLAENYRQRLMSISEYMGCLKQPIAYAANREDSCRGRFWEGRFKSQALLDEKALLTCMMYVDLNPIRAGVCDSLESSDFTSIQQRILDYAKSQSTKKTTTKSTLRTKKQKKGEPEFRQPMLQCFLTTNNSTDKNNAITNNNISSISISLNLTDYFELIDWTGRAVREDIRGAIPSEVKSLLNKLSLDPDAVIGTIQEYKKRFKTVVGPIDKLKEYAKQIGKKWLFGYSGCKALYNP